MLELGWSADMLELTRVHFLFHYFTTIYYYYFTYYKNFLLFPGV